MEASGGMDDDLPREVAMNAKAISSFSLGAAATQRLPQRKVRGAFHKTTGFPRKKGTRKTKQSADTLPIRLKEELLATKKSLQKFIENQTLTHEELRTSNEALQSTNEEVKTTDNKIDGAVIILNDIDVFKRSYEEIRRARNFAEAVLATIQSPFVILTENLRIKTVNGAFYRFFQTSKEETENKFIYELGDGQWNIPRLRVLLEELLPTTTHFENFEVGYESPHIGYKIIRLNARRIVQENHHTPMILLAMEDITEQKKAYDRLEATVQERTRDLSKANQLLMTSLKEKEVLLKEIQHRVKNNLQVISSLLNLQSERISDQQILELFKESQNRITSMAFIYEQLHDSNNIAWVDFAKYSHQLATNLLRSYGIDTNKIHIDIVAENIVLGIDTALPCGLIINELVTNALKYAFKENGAGHIQISFSATDKDTFILRVSDNGVGLPKGFAIDKTSSLGLQLTKTLTDQLGGTMKIHNDGGTVVQIAFTAPTYDHPGIR